ncbi:MAG: preprotein translocase subunit YajC [Pseudomonadota bacterium]
MLMNISIPGVLAMAASPGGSGGGQGSLLSTLLPLVVIFAIFYFLMIRPQQKQQKRHKEMLTALKKGDKVVTRGGMMGTVYAIAESIVTLEVADNVKIKFSRESIAGVEGATE